MTPAGYTFTVPGHIRFGWGCRSGLGEAAARLGRRAILVNGGSSLARSGRRAELADILRSAGLRVETVGSAGREPDIAAVDQLVETFRQLSAGPGDVIVAAGGGATLDLAKAAAGVCPQPDARTVRDFLEGIGSGRQLTEPAMPLIAIPTTAGTGSEATRNAVVASHDPPVKKSIRSESMIPRVALVDPELTVTLPPEPTAASGLDALTQLIESYLSSRRQPLPSALCLQGIPLAVRALPAVMKNPADQEARTHMAHAALLSGMALGNSGLGLAHGVAAALGAVGNVSHGLACAVMLPAALRFNRPMCEAELARLELCCRVEVDQCGDPGISGNSSRPLDGGGQSSAAGRADLADAFLQRIEKLCRLLEIPHSLSELGIDSGQLEDLVEGSQGNSLRGNPVPVSRELLAEVLESML